MSCENQELAKLSPEDLKRHQQFHNEQLTIGSLLSFSWWNGPFFTPSILPNPVASYHADRLNKIAEALAAKNQPNPTLPK